MTPASSDTCYPPDIRPLWNALPQPALRTATGMRAGTSQLPAGRAVIDRRWMVQAIIRAKQGHDWPDGPYLIDQSLHHGVLLAAAVVPRGSAGRTTGSGVPTTHDLMKDPTVPPRQDTTISDGPDRVADPVPSLPPLRGYQQEAVDAVAAGLAASGRGLVVAACGTGKTLVAVHAAVRLAPTGLIVVACPSLALLAQTLQVWSGCGLAAETLAVCSDDTVADAAVHVSDLDCPVTTAPEEITEWVRRTATTRLRLFLTTHASAGVAGSGLLGANTAADLLIVDEAHHTAGWHGKHSALVHHDNRLPARRRLYLTATPRILAANRRGKAALAEMLSMDDPAVFGPVRHHYPFAAAIADGWLDDYRVVVIGITCAEILSVLRRADDRAVVDRSGAPLRTAVVQTALARAAVEFGLRRVLVFTPRIAESEEFALTLARTVAAMPEEQRPKGRLTVGHVDGTQTTTRRQRHLANLADPPEDGWTVLSNARCLGEGVDVPAVDGVAFTWPKRSEADVVQAVGRALRRNPGGSGVATVLVPVLLPDDPADMLEADLAEWATLLQVLRALRAHDSGLALDLDTQRMNMGTSDTAELPPRVVLRLPDGYRTEDLLRHVTVRVLEQTTPDWLVPYAALRAFHAKAGHTVIPIGHRSGGVDLNAWLTHQRKQHRAGLLAADRVAALNELGIDWSPHADRWQRGLAAARAFHARHGHLRVPRGDMFDGVNLSNWLNNHRQAHRHGQLAPDRVSALDTLGIEWSPEQAAWSNNLAAATAFRNAHGHLRPPDDPDSEHYSLYLWIRERRKDYRNGKLPPDRIQALTALGIEWSPHEAAWKRNLAAATAYHTRENHLRVPKHHRENGVDLAAWFVAVRRARRTGKLAPDKIAALDAIAMDWNPTQPRRTP